MSLFPTCSAMSEAVPAEVPVAAEPEKAAAAEV